MLWLTNRIVRPERATLPIFPRHFCWKAASRRRVPRRRSGCRARGGPRRRSQPHGHPARVVLDRRVEERLDAGEVDDSSNLRAISAPRHAEDRAVQDRCSPVRSARGGNPVPTSRSAATRPREVAEPSVGSVMRERILSSVLFRNRCARSIPNTSPRRTSNDTSRSAQTRLSCSVARPPPLLRPFAASRRSGAGRASLRVGHEGSDIGREGPRSGTASRAPRFESRHQTTSANDRSICRK